MKPTAATPNSAVSASKPLGESGAGRENAKAGVSGAGCREQRAAQQGQRTLGQI